MKLQEMHLEIDLVDIIVQSAASNYGDIKHLIGSSLDKILSVRNCA